GTSVVSSGGARRAPLARKRSCALNRFDKIAQTLEHGAVSEPVGIFDQPGVVAVLALEKFGEAIGDMLDAAAERRVVEQIDDRAFKIGNEHLAPSAPEGFRAEYPLRCDVFDGKDRAVVDAAFAAHR